jgi:hypothetical protein
MAVDDSNQIQFNGSLETLFALMLSENRQDPDRGVTADVIWSIG